MTNKLLIGVLRAAIASIEAVIEALEAADVATDVCEHEHRERKVLGGPEYCQDCGEQISE